MILLKYFEKSKIGNEYDQNSPMIKLVHTAIIAPIIYKEFIKKMKAKDVEVTTGNEEYLQNYNKVQRLLHPIDFQRLLNGTPSSMPFILRQKHLNTDFLNSLCFLLNFHKLSIRFYIMENKVFDAPDSCALFTSYPIQELRIDHSRVGDHGVAVLAQITSLTRLSLSSSGITDQGAQILSMPPHLKALDVSTNLFTERGIKSLLGMSTLTELNISYNQTPHGKWTKPYFPDTKEYAGIFRGNTVLRTLRLSNNRLSEQFIESLAQNSSITAIDLGLCDINDAAVIPLSTMTNVLFLNLLANKLTSLGLRALALHPRLLYLSLNNSNNNVCPDPCLFANHPTLTDLELGCNDIDYESAKTFAATTRLRALSFWGNERLKERVELLKDYQTNSSLTDLNLGIRIYPPKPAETIDENKRRMLMQRSELVSCIIMIAFSISKTDAHQSIWPSLPKDLKKYILKSITFTGDNLFPGQAQQLIDYILDHIEEIKKLVQQRRPLKFYQEGVSKGSEKIQIYTSRFTLFTPPSSSEKHAASILKCQTNGLAQL